jgi:putative flippase GtrA
MIKKKIRREIIFYIIVGITSVVIDFLFYLFLTNIFYLNNSNSKRISYLIGSTSSFLLNKRITFKSPKKTFKEPILFSIVYLFSFVLNSFTHDIMLEYIDGSYPFIIATFISVIINYIGQKFIVFKKK